MPRTVWMSGVVTLRMPSENGPAALGPTKVIWTPRLAQPWSKPQSPVAAHSIGSVDVSGLPNLAIAASGVIAKVTSPANSLL
jgi:hypothetical protein